MSSITKFSKTFKCFYLCAGCITARPGKAIMLQGLEKGFLLYGSSCTSQTWGLERFPYYGSSCAARPRKVYVFIGANQVQTMGPTISHHTSRSHEHHHHHCVCQWRHHPNHRLSSSLSLHHQHHLHQHCHHHYHRNFHYHPQSGEMWCDYLNVAMGGARIYFAPTVLFNLFQCFPVLFSVFKYIAVCIYFTPTVLFTVVCTSYPLLH